MVRRLPLLGAIGCHGKVPLFRAVAGCHWVGRHGKVSLLGAIGMVHTLADWTWPLLDGIGWVHTLADWTWCRCSLPLLGAIG